MSGIEVAGLVLGAFPIFIKALEQYRDTKVLFSNWWAFKREYDNFKHEVEFQQHRFEQNLEIYLLPLIVDDDDLLTSLLANPHGPKWKDEQLEKRLKERIPESYDLYVQTIEAMNRVTEQLKQKLSVGKTSYEQEVRRLIFTFGKSPRDELLDQMNKYNDRLRDLLDTSDRITSLRRGRGTAKTYKGLLSFWNHAEAIYNLLKNSWLRQCCHSHRANLLLKNRLHAQVDFSVLFHVSDTTGEPDVVPWIWQDTNIKLFEKDTGGVDLTITVPQNVLQNSSTNSLPNTGQQVASNVSKTAQCNAGSTRHSWRKDMKSFRLATKRSPTPSPGPTTPSKAHFAVSVTNPSSATTASNVNQSKPAQITDLCHTLSSFCSASNSPILLKNDEHHYLLSPSLKLHPGASARQTVTLEVLLKRTSPVVLTRRDRYFIALTLASSQLQLYPTQWLGSQWKKSDIVFLCDLDNANKVSIEQPYISRNFLPDVVSTCSTTVSGDFSFSTLGIMLLELCFYKPFEDYLTQNSISSIDPAFQPILDHGLAMQWCGSAVDETGPEYADAVRWCLERTFSRKDQWRQELIQKVLEPLQTCYNHLAGVGS